jgi:hypothetical protein
MSPLMEYQLGAGACSSHKFLSPHGQRLNLRQRLDRSLLVSGENCNRLLLICAELGCRLVMGWQVEERVPLLNEQSSIQNLGQRVIRLLEFEAPLTNSQSAHGVHTSGLMNLDGRGLGYRVDIDQRTVRFEQTVDFLQGMNHAAVFHSAQRPRQHYDVEG